MVSKICDKWEKPDIDLFASRQNYQEDLYCSWKPDPGAFAVEAMCLDWPLRFFYAFPPFNMVGRVLREIEEDNVAEISFFHIGQPNLGLQSW